MNRIAVPFALAFVLAAIGCGGGPDLPPTTDPEAIRKEQERLRQPLPGSNANLVKARQAQFRGSR